MGSATIIQPKIQRRISVKSVYKDLLKKLIKGIERKKPLKCGIAYSFPHIISFQLQCEGPRAKNVLSLTNNSTNNFYIYEFTFPFGNKEYVCFIDNFLSTNKIVLCRSLTYYHSVVEHKFFKQIFSQLKTDTKFSVKSFSMPYHYRDNKFIHIAYSSTTNNGIYLMLTELGYNLIKQKDICHGTYEVSMFVRVDDKLFCFNEFINTGNNHLHDALITLKHLNNKRLLNYYIGSLFPIRKLNNYQIKLMNNFLKKANRPLLTEPLFNSENDMLLRNRLACKSSRSYNYSNDKRLLSLYDMQHIHSHPIDFMQTSVKLYDLLLSTFAYKMEYNDLFAVTVKTFTFYVQKNKIKNIFLQKNGISIYDFSMITMQKPSFPPLLIFISGEIIYRQAEIIHPKNKYSLKISVDKAFQKEINKKELQYEIEQAVLKLKTLSKISS